MLKLWENPMLSVDDRLDAACGEIERLRGQIESARATVASETTRRDELRAALCVAREALEADDSRLFPSLKRTQAIAHVEMALSNG